jgi:hypothetical protein
MQRGLVSQLKMAVNPGVVAAVELVGELTPRLGLTVASNGRIAQLSPARLVASAEPRITVARSARAWRDHPTSGLS